MKNADHYKKLLVKYDDRYFLKVCEELAEFQTALLHYNDGKVTLDDVVEEIADVYIQLEKTMYWLSINEGKEVLEIEELIKDEYNVKSNNLKNFL